MNRYTQSSVAEGPLKQPNFNTILMCGLVWERWFADRAGRELLQVILRDLESAVTGYGSTPGLNETHYPKNPTRQGTHGLQ